VRETAGDASWIDVCHSIFRLVTRRDRHLARGVLKKIENKSA
jgi:hypothetical protein